MLTSHPSWLARIASPWPILGLVVIEVGILAFIFSEKQEIAIPISILSALLTFVVLAVYFVERLRVTALSINKSTVIFRTISTRRDMYYECTKLINSSQSIRDTTWGKSPKKLNKFEISAREEYRDAIDRALKSGKDYKEMFCVGEDRKDLVDSSVTLRDKFNSSHDVKFLAGVDLSKIDMIDIVIGDSSKMILAHVAGNDNLGYTSKYIYIESAEIVGFFLHYWNDCWIQAVDAVKGEQGGGGQPATRSESK